MDIQTEQKIKQWIAEHREQVLEDWMALSRIPSIQATPEPGAPFGKMCAKALKFAADIYTQNGFSAKVYADSGYAVADGGKDEKSEKTIGLFGHSDVVPVGDGWCFTQPFEPIVRDGLLIGRGVSDNKSGVMAALCALRIIRDCEIPVHSRIRAFIGSNEESGMKDIEAFVREQGMPEVSLVPDSGFPCSIGERSIFRFWAESDASLCAVRDFSGGEAFNTVLDNASVRLREVPGLEEEIRSKIEGQTAFTLEKQNDEWLLTAKGRARHASDPDGSINATQLITAVLAECRTLPAPDRSMMRSATQILSTVHGESLDISYTDEFGQLTVANGMVRVKDGHFGMSFDIRYGCSVSAAEMEQKVVASFAQKGWYLSDISNRAGFSISEDHPIVKRLEENARRISGRDKKSFRMAGGTYARYLHNAFAVGTQIAAEGSEPSPLQMPYGHGNAHQCDECISVEGFWNAVRLLVDDVLACDEWLQEQ